MALLPVSPGDECSDQLSDIEYVEEVVRCAPLHALVLETDAPHFLTSCAPRSFEFSDPQMALQVRQYIARVKGRPVDEVLHRCHQNFMKLYSAD